MRVTPSQKATLNGLLRKLVRLRDSESCLRCKGKKILSLSHIKSVGAWRKMQFEPDNVKLLCYSCHILWWHRDTDEASKWIREIKPKVMKRLDMMVMDSTKNPFDYNLTKLYIESEIKKLEEL